jgi:hypothetical protein
MLQAFSKQVNGTCLTLAYTLVRDALERRRGPCVQSSRRWSAALAERGEAHDQRAHALHAASR